MTMQKNSSFQECVEKNIYQRIYLFLKNLIDKGAKFSYNYDVDKRGRSFSLDSICPNPFEKSVDMNDFPRKLEIPQYDKYDDNGDPSDHVH